MAAPVGTSVDEEISMNSFGSFEYTALKQPDKKRTGRGLDTWTIPTGAQTRHALDRVLTGRRSLDGAYWTRMATRFTVPA